MQKRRKLPVSLAAPRIAAAALPRWVHHHCRAVVRALGAVVLTLCSAAFLAALPLQCAEAASERYDYDPLGRLIRVIDGAGRVTEYEYDAAGNIRAVRTGGSAVGLAPTVTAVTPASFRKRESVQVTVTGSNFVGARLTSADPEVDIANVAATATQFRFSVSATEAALTGSKSFSVANAAGAASFSLTLAPPLPQASFNPQPIALPPDNAPRSFTLLLSNADTIEHTVSLATDNAAIATVSPASVTFTPGQTSATIQIIGRAGGLTTLRATSTTLGAASAPVFVTADFAGVRTTYASPVGVLLTTPPTTSTLAVNGLISPAVGVAFGPYLSAVEPRALPRGQTTRVTLRGALLQGVTAIGLSPSSGISVSNLVAAPDGGSVAADVTVAADAAVAVRQVVLSGSGGPWRPSAVDADRLWIVDGAPIITSIDPFQAAPGTNGIIFRVRGRNLQAAERILIDPTSNVRISSAFTVNADGTEISGGMELPFNARVGSYPIQVVTPAGASDGTASPANTFFVVNEITSVFTPIHAPLVGVVNGTAPAAALTGPLFAQPVGITLGSAISSVAPRSGAIGQTVTLVLGGTDLNGVSALQVSPSTGLAIGTPVPAADGRSVSVEIAVAADAPRTLRRLRVLAGSSVVPFTLPELGVFLVTEPQPELDSVSPIVLRAGNPPLSFVMRGRNLQGATAIRFVPATGITVGTDLAVNAGGTEASVSITVAADAPTGTRVAVIDTPAGSSSEAAAVNNTVTIAGNIAASYSGIVAPLVGVQNGPPVGPQPTTFDPIVSPLVGVLVQQAPAPVSSSFQLVAQSVGVALGAAAYQVTQTPVIAGGTGTLTVAGVNLQDVSAITVSPVTGLTLGTPTVSADGRSVTVSVSADAALPTSARLVRLAAGATAVPFANPAQSTLFVAGAAPRIDSIDPILATLGDGVNLLIRGANLQFATAVLVEPAAGVTVLTPPVVNAAGTEATVTLRIANDALPGARTIRIVTPGGGTTTDVAAPANTFTVFAF